MADKSASLIILRRRDVEARTGLPRSTIYYLIKQGKFPKQILLGERAVGWVESEIEEWIQEQINQARRQEIKRDG